MGGVAEFFDSKEWVKAANLTVVLGVMSAQSVASDPVACAALF
jgi:hypothetical protein